MMTAPVVKRLYIASEMRPQGNDAIVLIVGKASARERCKRPEWERLRFVSADSSALRAAWASQPPRPLAPFAPHFEQHVRLATDSSVADSAQMRAPHEGLRKPNLAAVWMVSYYAHSDEIPVKQARPERFELPTLRFEGSSRPNQPDTAIR
jgi:hypothetical protein